MEYDNKLKYYSVVSNEVREKLLLFNRQKLTISE